MRLVLPNQAIVPKVWPNKRLKPPSAAGVGLLVAGLLRCILKGTGYFAAGEESLAA